MLFCTPSLLSCKLLFFNPSALKGTGMCTGSISLVGYDNVQRLIFYNLSHNYMDNPGHPYLTLY